MKILNKFLSSICHPGDLFGTLVKAILSNRKQRETFDLPIFSIYQNNELDEVINRHF